MPQSSLEALVAQIEATIARGGFDEARQRIETAEGHLGRLPELDELRQRLAEVESTLSERGQIEAAMRRAREEISRANYPGALSTLEGALRLAPKDAELRQMLERTTKAAMRHETAVERNRAVATASRRIGALLEGGDLEKAATELREAGIEYGKHDKLRALQERLDTLWKEVELEKTVAYVDQGRAFLDGKNWQAALRQAESVLRRDPRNAEALELKARARTELDREEALRQLDQEAERARQDVERLIQADELPRATRALQEAVDRLGRNDAFDELSRRLDQAKADLQARKRLEWTQRRHKEAEDLVRQAGRFSLQGKYELALERLNTARELHPHHPEIEGMVQAAEAAQEREAAERLRSGALASSKVEVRQLLDGLRLDEAEARLEAAVEEFGAEDTQLAALRTRLTRLREAESTGGSLPEAAELEGSAGAAELERQRELAAAYSWKQVLLFPFRGGAVTAFWVLLVAVVALEALGGVPWVGPVFRVLRWLVPLAALGLLLPVARETLRGKNSLPPWSRLFDGRQWGLDLALFLGIAVLATLPLLVLVATRGWHALFAGSVGWWLTAALAWPAAAFVVVAGGAVAAFGQGRALRLGKHVRALRAGEPDTLLAANVVFVAAVAVVVLRVTFQPYIPWLGLPLTAAVEAYALLVAPHLIGVVARRHRIEMAALYR